MNTLRIRFEIFLVVVLLLIGCVPVVNAETVSSGTNLTNLTPNFTVYPAEPFITIDPIGNHVIGNVFFVNGTTNLPVSEKITMSIGYLKYIKQTHPKSDLGPPPNESAYVTAISIFPAQSGMNRWSANVTDITSGLKSGDYLVQVDSQINESCNITGCRIPDVSTTAIFTLLTANKSIKSNVLQTIVQSPTTNATLFPTTQSASLPFTLLIAVIVAIVISKPMLGKKRD